MNDRTDYIARTATGTVIETFQTRDQALAWAEVRGDLFPGWSIAKVERVTVVKTTVLRRDRSQSQHQGAAA